MSAVAGRGAALLAGLRNGAAAPIVVLALLAMVIVPLAPIGRASCRERVSTIV